ncbi:MAG: HdeD family acid-resistance protein [Candidatus Latescibacteria bacterium]|nr:HdeD family acid-resistance protein [bacterium]MBD3424316.1 HdeD family acid-resistance protein [Candidatus Latescibacterota bacterium]
MLIMVSRKWWALVLRGALAVALGILAFIWPGHTVRALFILVGMFLILDGAITVGSSVTHRQQVSAWWIFFVEGALGILVGLFALIRPETAAVVLAFLVGLWALITGILEIIAGLKLSATRAGEWLLTAGGVLSVIFGLILTLVPSAAVVALLWLVALYFIIFGALLIILGLRMRPYRGTPCRDCGRP